MGKGLIDSLKPKSSAAIYNHAISIIIIIILIIIIIIIIIIYKKIIRLHLKLEK